MSDFGQIIIWDSIIFYLGRVRIRTSQIFLLPSCKRLHWIWLYQFLPCWEWIDHFLLHLGSFICRGVGFKFRSSSCRAGVRGLGKFWTRVVRISGLLWSIFACWWEDRKSRLRSRCSLWNRIHWGRKKMKTGLLVRFTSLLMFLMTFATDIVLL